MVAGLPVGVADIAPDFSPDQESWDTRFYMSEKGVPRLTIDAPYMSKFESADSAYTLLRGLAEGDSVVARVYGEGGVLEATIVSGEMRYFEADQRFEARDAVRVTTESGRRLETDFLLWMELEALIRAPGFARIYAPGEELRGYDLTADERLDEYTL